jgi:predicted metal-dependent peptidase
MLRLAVATEIQRRLASEPGTVSRGWARWAEAVLPSRVDWRRALAAEIRSAVAARAGQIDFSHRRPSRRAHVTPRVVLPTMVRPAPDVAIVCDTSGSMHDGLLAQALAEVEAILRRGGLAGRSVRVLAVDAAVHTVRRVARASQVELAGGGGTDMAAGIAAAGALRPRPSVIVVLSDGWTPWPAAPPRGTRIVIGLLGDPGQDSSWPVSDWARVVRIQND